MRTLAQEKDSKLSLNRDWKDPKKELPREGEMCLVITDATAVPIYCAFQDELFYVVTTQFKNGNFKLRLDQLTECVSVLAWKSNFGTLIIKKGEESDV